jgi:L-alanine-DL-glutamate epimerase and related enzymes of enolase superfamily
MQPLLKNITIWKYSFPLRFSFSHTLATRTSAETLLVQIQTRSGNAGFGQALPRTYLTGETIESALESIQNEWWPRIAALDFSSCDTLSSALETIGPVYKDADAVRNNAAFAAVEIAALDAFCRERNIPLAPQKGGEQERRIPLVGVIPATGPVKAACMVSALRLMGYRHFKIKVGKDNDVDRERIVSVRRAAGKSAWLAVDANQAWTFNEAVERMREMRGQGIQLVEEPLRPGMADRLKELENVSQLPIMADETLCTLSDAHALIRAGGPAWWNVRIGKNGGFSAVRELERLAEQHAVTIYMGVLVGETSALAAAGRAAMFGAKIGMAEYGFPRVFLKGDPFRGGPGGWHGQAKMPNPAPGLGVAMNGKTQPGARLVVRRKTYENGAIK